MTTQSEQIQDLGERIAGIEQTVQRVDAVLDLFEDLIEREGVQGLIDGQSAVGGGERIRPRDIEALCDALTIGLDDDDE